MRKSTKVYFFLSLLLTLINTKSMTDKALSTVTAKSTSKVGLRGADLQNIYITLFEGSQQNYAACNSICSEFKERVNYAEVTNFPNYGSIFRCQCGIQWSSWYDINTLEELSLDILLGDQLFNNYINMLGFTDFNDCECESLKELLYRLATHQNK
jgi:hypothetical protein